MVEGDLAGEVNRRKRGNPGGEYVFKKKVNQLSAYSASGSATLPMKITELVSISLIIYRNE